VEKKKKKISEKSKRISKDQFKEILKKKALKEAKK